MTEDFLKFVWRYQLFATTALTSARGEPMQIISPGQLNVHAGPDFTCSKIKFAGVLWVGNIEVHQKGNDWSHHKHHLDKQYNSVILHVVYENGKPAVNEAGNLIPTISLKDKIFKFSLDRYQAIMHASSVVKCGHFTKHIDRLHQSLWLSRMAVERLESKSAMIKEWSEQNEADFNGIFQRLLMRSFGGEVNAIPFEMLSQNIPHQMMLENSGDRFALEALLFGQAGFLEKRFDDAYPKRLQEAYARLKGKHSLVPMDVSLWKFMRLRPANFPTVRIAQLAGICHSVDWMVTSILETNHPHQFVALFSSRIETDPYWAKHYQFDVASGSKVKVFGKQAIGSILINAVAPFLYFYGALTDDAASKERALDLLLHLKPEKNYITHAFAKRNVVPQNGLQSQALYHLRKKYCERKKCLNCSIGGEIIKQI